MKADVKALINRVLKQFTNVTTFTLGNNSSVSGLLTVTVIGRIATISGVLNYPAAGTGLVLAGFPSGYDEYKPIAQAWLSCDYYSASTGAEAWINTGGTVIVNQPAGSVDLKISGTWITQGG